MISAVYYVGRSTRYDDDESGEFCNPRDSNRIFFSRQEADAFAKVSVLSVCSQFIDEYPFICRNILRRHQPDENGTYILPEFKGCTTKIYSGKIELPKPVQIASKHGETVLSIVDGYKIEQVLFGFNRSEAIAEARKLAKVLLKKKKRN